jgi:threonine/homoserine efflux transporter RhtA
VGTPEANLAALSFRDAVLLFPLPVVLHVCEEWPGFPVWARRFASPRYSGRAYAITHALALVLALGSALLLRAFSAPWLVFAFFAFAFGPGVFCNAFFHAGTGLASRSDCPGVVTGLAVCLLFSAPFATLAVREELISVPSLGLALGIAAAFHTLEVGHNVFERW